MIDRYEIGCARWWIKNLKKKKKKKNIFQVKSQMPQD